MSKPIPVGLQEFLPLLFRPHPWNGVSVGDEAPDGVSVFIGVVETDAVFWLLRDLPAEALGA